MSNMNMVVMVMMIIKMLHIESIDHSNLFVLKLLIDTMKRINLNFNYMNTKGLLLGFW